MVKQEFSVSLLPRIEFGAGSVNKIPELVIRYGHKLLLVTGKASFINSSHGQQLQASLQNAGIKVEHCTITDEPSPELVDRFVSDYRSLAVDVVAGIGGGSVLDAAKAIAGLLPHGNSVMDHLEGVGPEKPYLGPSLPFIAVPTTAGTGSEATKNAVLSVRGENGFKKSFRDEQLVPDYAVVDPNLLATCPPDLVAANGMDALTQLMESYVSTRANPFTDALALDGLRAVREALLPWYHNSEHNDARGNMAYGALLSGITLAQCGLGSVHGMASPLGAFFPIPHGVVCGTLVATCTRINITAMLQREPDNLALEKYARLGALFNKRSYSNSSEALDALVALLDDWTRQMKLPTLSTYDIRESDFGRIIENSRGSSMKTNPIVLTDQEISSILKERL